MSLSDTLNASDTLAGVMTAGAGTSDTVRTSGHFIGVCHDADGNELWRAEFDNLLTTLGKNFLLDQALAGSAYTAAEYMGLISSTSYTAVAVTDTMAAHGGWLEAGSANAPTYAARLACAWSAASAGVKALSAGLVYTFTGAGTVQGAFIVAGSGASATLGVTTGTLYAAGALATPQPVISGNTLTLSYSSTLT